MFQAVPPPIIRSSKVYTQLRVLMNIMNRLQVYKELPYMNNRIKQVVRVTRLKCVKQEGLLNLLENILESVHLEDRVREGRVKKTNHREQSCDMSSK